MSGPTVDQLSRKCVLIALSTTITPDSDGVRVFRNVRFGFSLLRATPASVNDGVGAFGQFQPFKVQLNTMNAVGTRNYR
jgi:hypothetical protein